MDQDNYKDYKVVTIIELQNEKRLELGLPKIHDPFLSWKHLENDSKLTQQKLNKYKRDNKIKKETK